MLFHDMSYAFCAKTMPLFCRYRQALMKDWLVLIAVANVNAQLRILGIHTQPDDAFVAVRYLFTGMDSIFQSV